MLHWTYYQGPDTLSPEQTTAGTWRTRRRHDSSFVIGEKFPLATIRRGPGTCPSPLPPSPPSSRPCTRAGSLQTRGLAASQTTVPGSYLDGSLKGNRHFLFRKETFRRTMRRVRKPPSQEEWADMLGVGGTEAQCWARCLQKVKIRQTMKYDKLKADSTLSTNTRFHTTSYPPCQNTCIGESATVVHK